MEQTIRTEPVYTQHTVVQKRPLDYSNFFDFGFFADTAAQYGGASHRAPARAPVVVRKQVRLDLKCFGAGGFEYGGTSPFEKGL